MNWSDNILTMTDSYKVTHWRQYPLGTQHVYSYFESRGGPYPVLFFGLQYFLKQYLQGEVVTREKIGEAEKFFRDHFGDSTLFNFHGWEHILTKHNGRLPVVIKAVPEGTVVPNLNILMSIENTDPECHWLPNYLETLLVQVWYPCTVASQSRQMKAVIRRYLEDTGDPSLIPFKLHDFGFRGVSSVESAGIGGCAHLVNFLGTDTMAALELARKFYGCPMAGHSIPASEHSTITSWGEGHECDAFENMLDKYPSGLVACVSDSFDIYRACTEYWGGRLRGKVLGRNGTLVVRPDSGDLPAVVVEVLDRLGECFGFKANDKGYRVLDPHVRVIQGDGIDFEMLGMILEAMKAAYWSADNIAFGSGGGLLQKLNRDTLKFAFKCSEVTVNGERRSVCKRPVTDHGKQSKAGRLKLVVGTDGLTTVRQEEYGVAPDLLREVFRDGHLLLDDRLDDIRQRAEL